MKKLISAILIVVLSLSLIIPAGAAEQSEEGAIKSKILSFLEEYTINEMNFGTYDLSGDILSKSQPLDIFAMLEKVNENPMLSRFSVDTDIRNYLEKKIELRQENMRFYDTERENFKIEFSDIEVTADGDIALAQLQVYINYNYPGVSQGSAEMPRYLISLVELGGEWIICDMVSDSAYDRSNGKMYTEIGGEPLPPEPGTGIISLYTDVKSSDWFYPYVEVVLRRGFFNGTSYTTFSPHRAMTRGMFVTALGRIAGIDINEYQGSTFNDVKYDKYYFPYVNWANEKGIVQGFTPSTFRPNANVTREQAVLILSRFLEIDEYDVYDQFPCVVDGDTPSFTDIEETVPEFKEKYLALYQTSIFEGKTLTTFAPKDNLKRAEAAKILAYASMMLSGDLTLFRDSPFVFSLPWYWMNRYTHWPTGGDGAANEAAAFEIGIWESTEMGDGDYIDGYNGHLFSVYIVENDDEKLAAFKTENGSWRNGFSLIEDRGFSVILQKPTTPQHVPGDALKAKRYNRLVKDVDMIAQSMSYIF